MNTEIELKLEFEPAEMLRFRNWTHLRQITIGPVKRACMQAQYFDSLDNDLKKQKAALRIRREFGNIVQTFKQSLSEDLVQRRIELNFPLKNAKLDFSKLLAEDGCKEIFQDIELESLKEIFNTKIWRTARMLKVEDSEIELVIDSGKIFSQNKKTDVSEVELELISGDPDVLLSLANQWNEFFTFSMGGASKAERGYHLAAI